MKSDERLEYAVDALDRALKGMRDTAAVDLLNKFERHVTHRQVVYAQHHHKRTRRVFGPNDWTGKEPWNLEPDAESNGQCSLDGYHYGEGRRVHAAVIVAKVRATGVFDHVSGEQLTEFLECTARRDRPDWHHPHHVMCHLMRDVGSWCHRCGLVVKYDDCYGDRHWEVLVHQKMCQECYKAEEDRKGKVEQTAEILALRKLGVLAEGTMEQHRKILHHVKRRMNDVTQH